MTAKYRHVLGFVLGAPLLFLIGCGSGRPSVAPGASPLPSPAASLANTAACDLSVGLYGTEQIVQAQALVGADFVTRGKVSYHTLNLRSVKTLAERPPIQEYNGDDIQTDLSSVLVSPISPLVDQGSFDQVPKDPGAVLLVRVSSVGNGQFRPIVLATASLMPSGEVRLTSTCGQSWQGALNSVANERGVPADAAFLLRVAQLDTVEAEAVVTAKLNPQSHDEIWYSTDPPARSLDVHDIPIGERAKYRLVGVEVRCDPDLPTGFISLRTADGILRTFATSGVSAVLPVMVPRDATAVDIYFLKSPDDAPVRVTSVVPDSFDESLGSVVSVTASKNGTVEVGVEALAAGQLETALGMTNAEVEALRNRLLTEK